MSAQRPTPSWRATMLVACMQIACMAGCTSSPNPLTPHHSGSIGLPHKGTLEGGVELPDTAPGLARLRHDRRSYGVPRLVESIVRAAKVVDERLPGGTLVVGDLSAPRGGDVSGHASHRTGRDADLLFYVTTLEGVPVKSPGFLAFARDGLAYEKDQKTFYRFDVEREWLLLKTLIEDPTANVQFLFVHETIEAILLQWARARGEPTETIFRAMNMMLRPTHSQPHDDHVHLRTACLPEETEHGCVPSGPAWPWLSHRDQAAQASRASTTLDPTVLNDDPSFEPTKPARR